MGTEWVETVTRGDEIEGKKTGGTKQTNRLTIKRRGEW